jgi:hypothetical protein
MKFARVDRSVSNLQPAIKVGQSEGVKARNVDSVLPWLRLRLMNG